MAWFNYDTYVVHVFLNTMDVLEHNSMIQLWYIQGVHAIHTQIDASILIYV